LRADARRRHRKDLSFEDESAEAAALAQELGIKHGALE
jgi:hypothetical protein